MPRKPAYLTERQKEILEFLADFQRRQGVAPTLREICQNFGFSSYGTVYKHLKLLAQKGFLRRDWNQKRGLELLRPPGGAGPATGAPAPELPFYGRIAAGRPIEAVESGETLQVPGHLLGPRPGEHYVLRVVGDSMIEEGIQDGDWSWCCAATAPSRGRWWSPWWPRKRPSSASTRRASWCACSRPTRPCSRCASRRATCGCRGWWSA